MNDFGRRDVTCKCGLTMYPQEDMHTYACANEHRIDSCDLIAPRVAEGYIVGGFVGRRDY